MAHLRAFTRLFAIAGMFVIPAVCHTLPTPPPSLRPEPQQRDDYNWEERHQSVLNRNAKVKPEIVFIGDSITHQWGGAPASHRTFGKEAWERLFHNKSVTNLGFGYDYADNAYYRILHGELDGISPRLILINIGTNNLGHRGDSADACAANIAALVALVQKKQPEAQVLILGIYPRREPHLLASIAQVNARLATLADGKQIRFADIGKAISTPEGYADPRYFRDRVHPNAAGYERLAEALLPYLTE